MGLVSLEAIHIIQINQQLVQQLYLDNKIKNLKNFFALKCYVSTN
jgi:hypothetical protein